MNRFYVMILKENYSVLMDMTSSKVENSSKTSESEEMMNPPQVTTVRWYILTVLASIAFVQSWIYCTYSPIAQEVKAAYPSLWRDSTVASTATAVTGNNKNLPWVATRSCPAISKLVSSSMEIYIKMIMQEEYTMDLGL